MYPLWIDQKTFCYLCLNSHTLPANYILSSLTSPNYLVLTNQILVCPFMYNSVFLCVCCYICVCFFYTYWMFEKVLQIISRKGRDVTKLMYQIKGRIVITFSSLILEERNFSIFLSIILCTSVPQRSTKFDYQTTMGGLFLSFSTLYPSFKQDSLYIYSVTWGYYIPTN